MARLTCASCRADLTAYADQALPVDRREAVATHLLGCPPCREELAGLNDLRRLLGGSAAQAPASVPGSLSDRLVAIAGDDARCELWLCPDRDGNLPSPRRRRRVQALALSTMTACGLLGAVGSAWLMAPQLPTLAPSDVEPLATGLPVRASSVTSSHVTDCPGGFTCPETMAGMSLLAREVDSVAAPTRVTSTYGADGNRLVVTQRIGRLEGQQREEARLRVWQSGPTVFCVKGSTAFHTALATQNLPHEQESSGGGLQRLRRGFEILTGSRGR